MSSCGEPLSSIGYIAPSRNSLIVNWSMEGGGLEWAWEGAGREEEVESEVEGK